MEPSELIAKLKEQHRAIQADLSFILDSLEADQGKRDELILSGLVRFKQDLTSHLKIENEEFYPDLLKKKEKAGLNTDNTKDFIRRMETLAAEVFTFLAEYDSVEAIAADIAKFKEDLTRIISTLNVRIETEEEGVLDIYLLM